MRLLVLSNFYPPAREGGYTQWCHEVTEQLISRGHTVVVLTSDYQRTKAPADEPNVCRLLHLEGDLEYYRPLQFFTQWKKDQRHNLHALQQVVNDFSPDLIFVWGMWALSKALPALAESLLPGRVVYYLSDYWASATDMHTAYWRSPAQHGVTRPLKWVLKKLALARLGTASQPPLQFQHVMCVSAKVRELLVRAGVPVQHARIVHGGTDVERFVSVRRRKDDSGRLRLLYAGQLVRHKGVHTAIEAMAKLTNGPRRREVDLTIIGSGHPDYEVLLRNLVERNCLQDIVHFHGPMSRDQMPAKLVEFDVLVFPSIYEEPLARITQEAMLAGLVVIGTTTGGTPEVLHDGQTGLVFAPGDADGLANEVGRLISEPELGEQLSETARRTVLEHFTLDRMTREIEEYLMACAVQVVFA
jgi:glycogen(starch) synthase